MMVIEKKDISKFVPLTENKVMPWQEEFYFPHAGPTSPVGLTSCLRASPMSADVAVTPLSQTTGIIPQWPLLSLLVSLFTVSRVPFPKTPI